MRWYNRTFTPHMGQKAYIIYTNTVARIMFLISSFVFKTIASASNLLMNQKTLLTLVI